LALAGGGEEGEEEGNIERSSAVSKGVLWGMTEEERLLSHARTEIYKTIAAHLYINYKTVQNITFESL